MAPESQELPKFTSTWLFGEHTQASLTVHLLLLLKGSLSGCESSDIERGSSDDTRSSSKVCIRDPCRSSLETSLQLIAEQITRLSDRAANNDDFGIDQRDQTFAGEMEIFAEDRESLERSRIPRSRHLSHPDSA